MGGAGEGAPAASCSTETAFGLGSLSSKLVDPHLGSSQNWFRKRRLQMNFINLNCDNSLTRALPCTPRGLSYMSREGSNIGLTRPASPRTAQCGVSQPPAAAAPAPAILLSSLFPSAGKAAGLLARLRPQAAGPHCAPALVVFCRSKQLVPLPLRGAGWDSPPRGRCCGLRIASVCPPLQVLGGPSCCPHPSGACGRAGAHPQGQHCQLPACARVVPSHLSSVRRGIASHAWPRDATSPSCTVTQPLSWR